MAQIDEKILKENEIDANKQMINACLFSAVLLFLLWLGYITKLFPLRSYNLVHIVMPINIIILGTTFLYKKSKFIEYPRFKYFVMYIFMSVVFIINSIVPKHGIMAWAICIILSNHFYDKKFSTKVYVYSLIMMLLGIYLGMFIGEYDNNLLTEGKIVLDNVTGEYIINYPDTVKDRWEFLIELRRNGEDRFLKVFMYYYLSRAVILSIIFFVSQSLNKRTFKLLKDESDSTADKQRLETELSIARDIQFANLPNNTYHKGTSSIIAEVIPAKEVGGDLYDYYILDDDHIAILIGDVSGKGAPAAMFMMKTITCFKNAISVKKKPSEILKEVNSSLCKNNDNMMFVTCFLGIIDLKNKKMIYANAGHNHPIIGHNKNYHYLKCNSGFLLGTLEFLPVIDEEVDIENGDVIFLYTDGITEARDANGGFYSEDRLINFFNNIEFNSLTHLQNELKDELFEYTKGAIQSDDITYLVFEFNGDEIYYETITTNSTKEEIEQLTTITKEFLNKYHLEKEISNILVVVDEIASNISKYSYGDSFGEIYYRIMYNVTKGEINLTFIDKGIPFNQLDVDRKQIDNVDVAPGGLGILIVKKLMDQSLYSHINNKNILQLRKKVK